MRTRLVVSDPVADHVCWVEAYGSRYFPGGDKRCQSKKQKNVFILLTFKHCITSVIKKFCGSILNKTGS